MKRRFVPQQCLNWDWNQSNILRFISYDNGSILDLLEIRILRNFPHSFFVRKFIDLEKFNGVLLGYQCLNHIEDEVMDMFKIYRKYCIKATNAYFHLCGIYAMVMNERVLNGLRDNITPQVFEADDILLGEWQQITNEAVAKRGYSLFLFHLRSFSSNISRLKIIWNDIIIKIYDHYISNKEKNNNGKNAAFQYLINLQLELQKLGKKLDSRKMRKLVDINNNIKIANNNLYDNYFKAPAMGTKDLKILIAANFMKKPRKSNNNILLNNQIKQNDDNNNNKNQEKNDEKNDGNAQEIKLDEKNNNENKDNIINNPRPHPVKQENININHQKENKPKRRNAKKSPKNPNLNKNKNGNKKGNKNKRKNKRKNKK